jgi:DNA invertase Pin-like site-specific DNA recombinase
MDRIAKRCAIYTRKSTDEGLEQDFNSLDAQREACEAYITSQKTEGWQIIPTEYNDGGYSGGTMKRPALQRLIADIKKQKVDIIVVYKIDRLTRSLMDFSKLVEIFDEYGVTFVSVTQSFNTTTSMGRLTLNVLLSFAQFEREVTGERIRDKIAASKKKGMWMGGFTPLGYVSKDGKLSIHHDEAETVRLIFEKYLELKNVRPLKEFLDERHIRTPSKTSRRGKIYGNAPYSRGHLYTILKNPVYVGKISHKGKIYDGQHEAIIDDIVFDDVQKVLSHGSIQPKENHTKNETLLKGLIYDSCDIPYTPVFTKKKAKNYHYYVHHNLLQYKSPPKGFYPRLPKSEFEKIIFQSCQTWLGNTQNLEKLFQGSLIQDISHISKNLSVSSLKIMRAFIHRIEVAKNKVAIFLDAHRLHQFSHNTYSIELEIPIKDIIKIETYFNIETGARGSIILKPESVLKDPLDLPPERLKRLVKGIIWRDEHFDGKTIKDITKTGGHSPNYVRRCIHESFDLPIN